MKSDDCAGGLRKIAVAPLAGAWIEIFATYGILKCSQSRPPRGGVD